MTNNNSYYLDKTKSKDSFPEIETVNGKFCKYCGSHIDLDSIFFPECGRRVENISADQAGSELRTSWRRMDVRRE